MEAVEELSSSEGGGGNLCSPSTHHMRQTSLVTGKSHSSARAGNGGQTIAALPSPSPALALAGLLSDHKSRVRPAPVSLPTARGGCKDEGWDCHIYLWENGGKKLRMESTVPHSPATLAPLRAFADICRGLAGLREKLGACGKKC